MPIAAGMLAELEHEAANTRKTLERIPNDKLSWKPHDKCGSLQWMAAHVVNLPMWGAQTIQTEKLAMDDFPAETTPETTEGVLELFDQRIAEFRTALKGASDEDMLTNWELIYKGQPLISMHRVGVLRGMVLNHMIHHRGQLTMYLRLANIPVPGLYGPSADEQG